MQQQQSALEAAFLTARAIAGLATARRIIHVRGSGTIISIVWGKAGEARDGVCTFGALLRELFPELGYRCLLLLKLCLWKKSGSRGKYGGNAVAWVATSFMVTIRPSTNCSAAEATTWEHLAGRWWTRVQHTSTMTSCSRPILPEGLPKGRRLPIYIYAKERLPNSTTGEKTSKNKMNID